MTSMKKRHPLCLVGFCLLLAGCASKLPSGYGLGAKSTAQQAQEQMQTAELATQVDTAQTYLDLISQMQQAGQWYASLAHVDAFEQKHGASDSSQLLRADALRNTGQTEAARNAYQALLGGPNAARAHRGLGLLHASLQQFDQATEHLEQARRLNPIDATVLSDLAYAHMLGGNLDAARLPAMQAAQLGPGDVRAQLNLALYLMAMDSTTEANQVIARLSQAPARGQQPLLDQGSLQALQLQVASVKQAARLRAAAERPARQSTHLTPAATLAPPQAPVPAHPIPQEGV